VIGQALAAVLMVVSAVTAIASAVLKTVAAAQGQTSWLDAGLSILMAALACTGLGALRAGLGGLMASIGAWTAAGGLKGLGGIKGLALGTGQSLMLSTRNLGKLAKLLLQRKAPPRFGQPQISHALYVQLRRGTPTEAIRDLVDRASWRGMPDFALPGKTIVGNSKHVLEADHILSMERITTLDGFGLLSDADKLLILNFPDNFIGLSRSANASKGGASFADWLIHRTSGLSVDPLFRSQMIHLEKAMAGRIQSLIDSLLH